MRWATFRSDGERVPLVGCVKGDVLMTLPPGETMLRLLRLGPDDMATAAERALRDPWTEVAIADARLLAPVPVPPSVRDFMAFEGHYQSAGRTVDPHWYQEPAFYFSNPAAICGPYDAIAAPHGCTAWDYEIEVAVIIAGGGRDLKAAEAEQHIGGYTIMCDFSDREAQRREAGLGLGPVKGKDTATSLGPFLVTGDELAPAIGPGAGLSMTVAVDGRLLTQANLKDMFWSFPQMIEQASRGTSLRAGDVLGSGTPMGGCLRDLRRTAERDHAPDWLRPGNTVELTVAGLGVLRHDIIEQRTS